ncbi:SFCGS family glycine-rich protein [Haloimpatiens massiliensis]|uniref:SFCGS family glycine-rich protein n=1 Tax=Haloimpatiens massiliensis TaxID=1658110 RepID=UPI000C8184F4|nr:SFCGS family glycine-rich protein [Haloimpatiens massiliensis]
MEKQVVVVIGHRLGKGEKVAAGVEKGGGKAIVIKGMAADMKLGDVMKENNADIGISFCGSGGAGALMAANKYGYKAKHHLRSVEAGITALKEGNSVLGFGFMDVEELGEKLVKAYMEINKG